MNDRPGRKFKAALLQMDVRGGERSRNLLDTNEQAIFEQLGYLDIQILAIRVRAEVLWGMGLMDTICPPSSQFAIYNKLTSSKSLTIYPDFGHEPLPGHSDRILQFLIGAKN